MNLRPSINIVDEHVPLPQQVCYFKQKLRYIYAQTGKSRVLRMGCIGVLVIAVHGNLQWKSMRGNIGKKRLMSQFVFEKTPHISLSCKLVPVQYRVCKNGLFPTTKISRET